MRIKSGIIIWVLAPLMLLFSACGDCPPCDPEYPDCLDDDYDYSYDEYDAKEHSGPLTCRDYYGRNVPYYLDTSINDVARVGCNYGYPIVRVNPYRLTSYSKQFREMIYAHECGHHALGHMVNCVIPPEYYYSPAYEQAADCFGICKILSLNLISINEVPIIQNEISTFPASGWHYLPGPQRAINLNWCIQNYCPGELYSPAEGSDLFSEPPLLLTDENY